MTDCQARLITLDSALRADEATWAPILGHEFGHVLGLNHTGFLDSFGSVGERALLTTCYNTAQEGAVRTFAQDDGGGLTQKHSAVSPTAVHLNWGFEQSTYPWGELNGGLSLSSTEKFGGQWGGIYQPTASSNLLYQTMNYAAYGTRSIDAVGGFRRRLPSDTGGFALVIYGRPITYPANTTTCSWPTGKNQNTRTYGDYVTLAQATYTPPAGDLTWHSVYLPLTALPTADAYDLKVAIKSYVVSGSGALASVGVDNLRVRDRG